MDVKTIVDAGPLIGWLNFSDQWRRWSVDALKTRRGALHPTEVVLGEACYQLGGNSATIQALLTLVREGAVVLHTLWPQHLLRTQELMMKFDRMDAGEASLIMLSELYPRAKIVTVDLEDFRIYRWFRDQLIPLLAP